MRIVFQPRTSSLSSWRARPVGDAASAPASMGACQGRAFATTARLTCIPPLATAQMVRATTSSGASWRCGRHCAAASPAPAMSLPTARRSSPRGGATRKPPLAALLPTTQSPSCGASAPTPCCTSAPARRSSSSSPPPTPTTPPSPAYCCGLGFPDPRPLPTRGPHGCRLLVRRSSLAVQIRTGTVGSNSDMLSSTYAPFYRHRTSGMAH